MVLSPDGTLVRIVVALGQFDESSPDQKPLADYHRQPLRLPKDESLWPSREHVQWHRRKRFLGQ